MKLFENEGCRARSNPAALLATRFCKGNSSSKTDTTVNNNQVAAQSGGVAVGAGAGAINLTISNTATQRNNISSRRSVSPTVNTSGAAPGYTINNTTNDPATAIAAINGNLAVINSAAGVVNNLVSQTIAAFTDRAATVVTGAPGESPAASGSVDPGATVTGSVLTSDKTYNLIWIAIGVLVIVAVIRTGKVSE